MKTMAGNEADQNCDVTELYSESLAIFNSKAECCGYRQLRTCSRCSTIGMRFGVCPQSMSRYIPDEGLVEFGEHDDRCPLDDRGPVQSTDCIVQPWIPDHATFQGVLRTSGHVICLLFRTATVDVRLLGVFYDVDVCRAVGVLDVDWRQLEFNGSGGNNILLTQSSLGADLEYALLLAQTNYTDWVANNSLRQPIHRSFSIYVVHATGDLVTSANFYVNNDVNLQPAKPPPVRLFDRIVHVYANIRPLDCHIIRAVLVPGYRTEHCLVFGARDWPEVVDGGGGSGNSDCQLVKLDVVRRCVVGVLPTGLGLEADCQVRHVTFAQDNLLAVVCIAGAASVEFVVLRTGSLEIVSRVVHSLPMCLRQRPPTSCLPCFVNVSPSVSCDGRKMALVRFEVVATAAQAASVHHHQQHLCRHQFQQQQQQDATAVPTAFGRAEPRRRRRSAVQRLAVVYQLPQSMLPLRSMCKLTIQRVLWRRRNGIHLLPLPRALISYLSDW